MDYTKHLREDQWERIQDSLPGKVGDVSRTGDNRRFIEVVMWIGRTGAPWRSLPGVYGSRTDTLQTGELCLGCCPLWLIQEPSDFFFGVSSDPLKYQMQPCLDLFLTIPH